ncbi:metal-dependent hydrolase family protein [Enterovirga rhinocerotis]|uniref:Secreted protein n=1 Tax=Enterovirga rhinocerotis TaxID=1339210 RepID=A0A4R7BY13_9HYPH|nr:amidohydrolase family protein [Enterovirga rhinocerotis]TDR90132.1 secreted protein [Enterovirga rhinocerotis]
MIRVGQKYQHLVHGLGCGCQSPLLERASRRLDAFSRRGFLTGVAALAGAAAAPALAQPSGAPGKTLLRRARLFDGKADSLRAAQILIEGGRVISVDTTNAAPQPGWTVIDCGDRMVMPGLIDAHWHTLFAAVPAHVLVTADPGAIFAASTAEAARTLQRGFTTVRDLGGPVFSFKQAIDTGVIPGPRIYPSGAMITTSGGHADLRMLTDIPREPARLSKIESFGGAMIADSVGELKLRIREQLLQGASQIKLVGGGGVSSPRSPLDMVTFGEDELRAGVEVARDWNTYVAVHAFAPQAVQRAVAAGAACIEHAHLMDEKTAASMAEKGVWLSIQPFLSEADSGPLTGASHDRMQQVIGGTPTAFALARKHGIKTAWGSDILFSAQMTPRQGTMLSHLGRWYSNAEALRMATSGNAGLLALSGPRNPYPGKLGVIEEGAFADILVVNGNLLENLSLIEDPGTNLALVMKDGQIHKNTLRS